MVSVAVLETCAAIRSRSLLPWLVILRPPFVGSFSIHLSVSSVWRALRATEPDPERQWLGLVPLFRRTRIEMDIFSHDVELISQ